MDCNKLFNKKFLLIIIFTFSFALVIPIQNQSRIETLFQGNRSISNTNKVANAPNILKIENSQANEYNLGFGTYFGGNGDDGIFAMCTDSKGNTFITGTTNSGNFPAKNAYASTISGSYDAFISEFNASGYLVFSTFLGGSNADQGNALFVDSVGNIYVTGATLSINFPIKNAYQSQLTGGSEAFLTKFTSNGSLVFSTYLGGSSSDVAYGITVDHNGNIYITGQTTSPNFPTKNAWNKTNSGMSRTNGFLAKYDSQGELLFSTYINGNGYVYPNSIALDSTGNVFISGYTNTTTFPTTPNAFQHSFTGGVTDAFLSEFNSTGSLIYSSYFGGNNIDNSNGVTVDSNDNVYLVGKTMSTNLPTTSNAFNKTLSGGYDAYVAKFSKNQSLTYGTYIGGTGDEEVSGVKVDTQGNIYVAGDTNSINYPMKDPYNTSFAGFYDIFISKFNSSDQLNFSTFYGGIKSDFSYGLGLDSIGNIYFAGETYSGDIPLQNAYFSSVLPTDSIFVSKFSNINTIQSSMTSTSQNLNTASSTSSTIASTTSSLLKSSNDLINQELLSNPIFAGSLVMLGFSLLTNIIFLIRRRK